MNADDSSMTTKGKHMNAARRAVDYGRGAFANCHSVPGLTRLVDVWRPRVGQRGYTGPETVQRLARHLESAAGAYWPGAEAAEAIYRAAGATEAEAARRARAGADRVSRAERKAAEAKARRELKSNAREAKRLAKYDPAETGAEIRAYLSAAAGESKWNRKRTIAGAKEQALEAFRAAKAAKAKGWPRIAEKARAHYKAARIEFQRFERAEWLYSERAALRNSIKAIRGASEQIRAFWADNPEAAEGVAVSDHGAAVRSCENGARGFSQLEAALERLADSRYAAHIWPGDTMLEARRAAYEAAQTAEALRLRAGQIRTEWQANGRALWLAGGNPSTWQFGRLCDERGAALLRAEGVERDDSGAIVGGTLRTSWGATVPLPHAIRAFQFLRHCRDTRTEWRANGRTLRVGHFRVDHIDSEGNFVAGCHRISWAECSRLAASLGLAELAGADTTEDSRETA